MLDAASPTLTPSAQTEVPGQRVASAQNKQPSVGGHANKIWTSHQQHLLPDLDAGASWEPNGSFLTGKAGVESAVWT